MDGYEPKDTANDDETGLFFQTLCLKGEKCPDRNFAKKV
jgi:hypothetical protein